MDFSALSPKDHLPIIIVFIVLIDGLDRMEAKVERMEERLSLLEESSSTM